MKHLLVAVALVFAIGAAGDASAGGRRGGGKSSRSSSTGTGSKSSSTRVKGYTTKRGTYVAPHRRTTSDGTQRNNYSTKGNTNSWTGKTGKTRAKR
jgi:hypothetical protein